MAKTQAKKSVIEEKYIYLGVLALAAALAIVYAYLRGVNDTINVLGITTL
jgi:hypothetical protein